MLGIVTDSGCGITTSFMEEMGNSYIMVGMKIYLGEDEYVDGKFDKEKFYNWISAGKDSKTSQPSPIDFENAYRELLKRGYDEILSFHISSKVSGAFNSARIAANNVEPKRIHVVDSQHISAGVYFMLRRIIDYVKNGMPLEEALGMLDVIRKNSNVFFTVSTLDHLIKNGRIGKAAGLVGSVLKLSPILTVKDGETGVASIARGKKRMLLKMTNLCKDFLKNKEHRRLLFAYSSSSTLKMMEEIKEKINETEELSKIPQETLKMWPTITTHTGPTTIGIGCYGE
ncbi:DegV family protein [Mesoaciditoga lauensis]|uniref:DegV family protein n=1 Tax=Mesoaciditoga lauensis TaxID=1495039 RepID=UPI00068DB28A|nr:DegV family protein [Mesoaciditoga lauensis]